MRFFYILIVWFFLFSGIIHTNTSTVLPTSQEWELYQLINNYRKQRGLPGIPLSTSLTQVAQEHCKDLAENVGYLTHGWSDCPYQSGKTATYNCMWEQPKNRTAYPGYGYENAYMHSAAVVPVEALASWKNSPAHHAVIINSGIWKDKTWRSIGVGIFGQYACIWFGEETDPAGYLKQ